MTPRHQYAQLLAQLQLYLTEMTPRDLRLPADPDTYAFFVDQARKGYGRVQKAPPPQAIPASYEKEDEPAPPPPAPKPVTPLRRKPPPPRQAKPAPQPEAPANTPPKQIALEAPAAPAEDSMGTMREKFRSLFPDVKLHDGPPDDSQARQKRDGYQTRQPKLIGYADGEHERPLLSKIVSAVDAKLSPARMTSKDELAEQLKSPEVTAILLTRRALEAADDATRAHLLSRSHILIDSLDALGRDPQRKRALWETLKSHLAS